MVKPIDSTPPADNPSPATGAKKPATPPLYGSASAKPMTFLGMRFTGPEAEKLWGVIIQQINTSIQHEQARMMKALKKLKKSSTGEGGDD